MIVTILPSSTSFHAVGYNEHKVAMGVAELMEMRNFGHVEQMGDYTPEDLCQYLMDYSSADARIRKPQFHVAFSCRGTEMSHQRLLDFAHEYLRQMGYAEEGQPLLAYAHHDTDNNHIHVVTTRVTPDGHKIDHNNERIRSQETINRILGEDEELRANVLLGDAMEYRFSSLYQFRAIMETSGYECYTNDDEMHFKRGGKVVASVPIAEIMARIQQMEKSEKRKIYRLRALLKKFQGYVGDLAELTNLMKLKFGVDLVFFGAKDKPYGYMAVDHKHRAVYNGASIMPVLKFCRFPTSEERLQRIEQFIDALLEEYPRLTVKEVNHHLWRQYGTHISKRRLILYNKVEVQLNPAIADTLVLNFRLAKAATFLPANEAEREAIASIYRIKATELLPISKAWDMKESSTAKTLREAVDAFQGPELFDELRKRKLVIMRTAKGEWVCVDFGNGRIATLERLGIKPEELTATLRIPLSQDKKVKLTAPLSQLLHQQGGASDQNREHEVGRNSYGEVDDERTLKR